jgi:long-chain acyl-CoA synthetase
MYTHGTYRSIQQRLRLALHPRLGAGNFFWHAWAVAGDRERPIVYHPDTADPHWDSNEIDGLSLSDLRSSVLGHAHWYRERGIGPGDRVGVYTRDGLLTFVDHIAITSLGAVAVHANPKLPAETAADYFERAQPSILTGDSERVAAANAARLDGASARPPLVADARMLDAEASAPPDQMPDHPFRHAGSDLVMLCHSSGTTGRPKATMFGHRSFFIGKRERLFSFPSLRSDRLLTALPHSHSAGISYLMLTVLLGIPTFVLDDTSGPAVARAMNRFLPTTVIGFPSTLADLPTGDLSPEAARTVHTWMGMGDASHERHIRPLLEIGRRRTRDGWIDGSRYLDGLGSSEMGMVLFSTVHTPESSRYGRTIGRPSRVVRQAAALDESGRELGPGQAGLLGVRTPSVTPGYWADPELTERSRLAGYWLTGDIASRDADGTWHHLDRTPDVIRSASGPIYSLPIEEVVLLATGAADAAVIAADDSRRVGSVPIAVVRFRNGPPAAAAALLRRCNDQLGAAGQERLRALVVAAGPDDFPVGVTGKALKRELRERHHALLSSPDRPGVALDQEPAGTVEPAPAGAAAGGAGHGA